MKNTTAAVRAVGARRLGGGPVCLARATSASRHTRAENSVLPEPMDPMTRMRREARVKSKWLKAVHAQVGETQHFQQLCLRLHGRP